LRFRYSAEENGALVKKALVYTQDEHKINYHDVDSHAVYITERLQASGYDTYIVGGAVRDLILGKKPKDFDIVTAASPPRIKKIFRNARIIGRRFRLVHVFFGSKIIEVSTFRSTKDGHTGNTFGTIEEDVLRRDFSVNALFYDPLKQLVIDYVGGMKDIQKGIIRPLIPLTHIFADDPVRIIRAVKYAALAGFKLPFSLKRMIRKQSSLLADVSPSRLTEEIFKIIYSSNALEIVTALIKLNIYGYLQPEAVKLINTLPCFREKYLKSIAALGSEGFRNTNGEALSSLVRDYLEETVDWDESQGISELYKNAFILARKFVLPMNPPRVELDHALKIIFAGHGLHVKRTRFSGYNNRKSNSGVITAEN
jgi:poly(A) polymerase